MAREYTNVFFWEYAFPPKVAIAVVMGLCVCFHIACSGGVGRNCKIPADCSSHETCVFYFCAVVPECKTNNDCKSQKGEGYVCKADAKTGNPICVEGFNNNNNSTKLLIYVRKFQMGSPDNDSEAQSSEKPQHEVTLTKNYWMDETEVTQRDFQSLMGYNPSSFRDCGECPVEMVSWHEALAYSNARSRKYGLEECFDCSGSGEGMVCKLKSVYAIPYECTGWRLPTEAEWEYAARAGTTEARYGSLDEIAWYSGNVGNKTHPVRQKKPNVWELYDMLGNVSEWTYDWYQNDYNGSSVSNPAGPNSGSFSVIRGGSWSDSAGVVRAADRRGNYPGNRLNTVGFRLVRGDYQ